MANTNNNSHHYKKKNVVIPTEEQVIKSFGEICNWGRWGEEDEVGTINFITNEIKLNALQSVKSGVSVSLSRPLEFFTNSPDTTYQSMRVMVSSA